MSETPFRRIRDLFDQLAELPAAERAGYLAAQADLGEGTRRQIEDLLLADAQLGSATARAAVRPAPSSEAWTGRRIGAFRISRELGRGGMGSVFLAERVDGGVTQQVAIKIVRPEMLDAATLARFRLERQLLALLQHPNIPTMLDLGELDDGSPYAVMEYVDGIPIDRYVREQQLDLKARLRLFLLVCAAVAYAHRNLIVHRDLKPSNVLVDAAGQPQLLDFGIAKPLLAQVGAVDVEETGAAQRFLSLSHAAPEQFSGGPITTACDVYSLGVLLYELLAGTTPFRREALTPAQLEQQTLHVDPAPPSRAAAAADGSGLRIGQDLDLITLRCLRKQPVDRYVSVDQLAEDLQRYLAGHPVLARRGNLAYRLGRFVTRHRTGVTAAAAVLALLLSGALLLWRQQQATARQQLRADEMSGLLMDTLLSVDPDSAGGRDLSAREVFERVAAQAKASPDLSAESRARILGTVAQIDLGLGYPTLAENAVAGLSPQGLEPLQRNELLLLKARTLLAMSRNEESRRLIDQGLAESAGDARRSAVWKLLDASHDYHIGHVPQALQKIDAITPDLLEPAQEDQRRLLRADALRVSYRPEEGIKEIEAVVAAQRARLGADSPAVFQSLQKLAIREADAGDLERGETLFKDVLALAEKSFSRTSARYAEALSVGVSIETRRRNFAKATEYLQQIIPILIDQVGEVHPRVAYQYLNLASIYEESGQLPKAGEYYAKGAAVAERVWLGDDTNLLLFRVAAASHFALVDDCARALEQTTRGVQANLTYPELLQSDGAPLMEVLHAYCGYRLKPDPAGRSTLARGLKRAQEAAQDASVKQAVAQVVRQAAALGVQPAE
ncbi:serine/threonine-protein kinase [Tahibacter harae]|uniref:Protein kinase n=1 Tax=Tahibacter harae TaxID=2963937 RepID=A0ABT1QN88_9GAMM|nr:serine/threonine-protein kinase [Tahibacter harae]MCQ4163353.1 protein kinase [Tahibacter harae]